MLSPENTKNCERKCYDLALCIASVDMKILEKKYFWYSPISDNSVQ